MLKLGVDYEHVYVCVFGVGDAHETCMRKCNVGREDAREHGCPCADSELEMRMNMYA